MPDLDVERVVKTCKIRYNYNHPAATMPDLHDSGDHLLTLLHHQYPATMEPTYVQFIPEEWNEWRVKKESLSEVEVEKVS